MPVGIRKAEERASRKEAKGKRAEVSIEAKPQVWKSVQIVCQKGARGPRLRIHMQRPKTQTCQKGASGPRVRL